MTSNRLTLFLEERFVRSPDGRVWTTTGAGTERWNTYLEVFDEILIAARVGDGGISDRSVPADGARIAFHPVPYFIGPRSFLRIAPSVRRTIREATAGTGPFIIRLPGLIGTIAGYALVRAGKPYAVELVGDADSVFRSVGGMLAPVYRFAFARWTRFLCARAAAVSYVTSSFLQEKYPPACPGVAWHCPSVDVDPSRLPARRVHEAGARPIQRILTAGSLEQRYKGVDILLHALAQLRDRGMPLRLKVAGDGIYRGELEQLARTLGIEDRVSFLGFLTRSEVLEEMTQADLFVLASRTEGLPRVIVEAMTAGLPVVATRVGGIPELLSEKALVPPEDAAALADGIARMVNDPDARLSEARRNLSAAQSYWPETLRPRRRAFYEAVRAASNRA